ncbi:MAG: GntR family transcriptional regulator [Pseudomonadota bacterium]|nr:GntR family transcriptional regulator [Pseudomonadota bacterium]
MRQPEAKPASRSEVLRGTHRIKRQGLHETLADSLRERILDGEFKEGEQLVQEAIAAEYEVSRMPVREAFRQLEASGLISNRLHKGAVVTSLPLEQISELFDLRALLECNILAYAIHRATEETLDAARSILSQLEKAYYDRDIGSWGALNWAFHRSLYVPAGRVQTMTVIQGVNVQTDRYIRLQMVLTDAVAQAEKEHRELFRLYAEGDADKATPYLRGHILNAKQDLIVAISKSRSSKHAV